MGKQWQTLFFWAPKSLQMVTAAIRLKDACSLEEKLWPAYARQHIKKQGHYFVKKGLSSQCNGFSSSHVWCESWIIKKAEHQRIDAFELWCWRKLIRVPWTVGRSNQSILKEISFEYSLEGLMLKSQYFGHLMWRTDSFGETQKLGKIEGRSRRGQHRVRWWDGITNLISWWWTGKPRVLQSMGVAKSRTRLSDWTDIKHSQISIYSSKIY